MGLPMAVICAVDNQLRGYDALISAGLALGLGKPPHRDLSSRVKQIEKLFASSETLAAQGKLLKRTVDGLGSWRIVSAWESIRQQTVQIATPKAPVRARAACEADARLLFEWRNDPQTRLNSRVAGELDWDVHREWLRRTLADSQRQLFVVEEGGRSVGTIRWDHLGGKQWEVSITVAPHERGRGLAAAILRAGEQALELTGPVHFLAGIHRGNVASLRLFARAGYLPYQPFDDDGFGFFAKWRMAS